MRWIDGIRRANRSRLCGLLLGVLVGAFTACSGSSSGTETNDNGGQAADAALGTSDAGIRGAADGVEGEVDVQPPDIELSAVLPISDTVEVPWPAAPENQGEAARIAIKNVGDATAKFTGFDLTGPEELVVAGEPAETSCVYDPETPVTNAGEGNCAEGQYCDEGSRTCRAGGSPETPLHVAPDSSTYISLFFVAHEPGSVECPAPDGSDPAPEGRRYCGEIRIETDANSGDEFADGVETFPITVEER